MTVRLIMVPILLLANLAGCATTSPVATSRTVSSHAVQKTETAEDVDTEEWIEPRVEPTDNVSPVAMFGNVAVAVGEPIRAGARWFWLPFFLYGNNYDEDYSTF